MAEPCGSWTQFLWGVTVKAGQAAMRVGEAAVVLAGSEAVSASDSEETVEAKNAEPTAPLPQGAETQAEDLVVSACCGEQSESKAKSAPLNEHSCVEPRAEADSACQASPRASTLNDGEVAQPAEHADGDIICPPHEAIDEVTCHVEAQTSSTVESSGGEACSCASDNTPGEAASCTDAKTDDVDSYHEDHGSSITVGLQGRLDVGINEGLRPKGPSENFLLSVLVGMDFHLRSFRQTQQWLVRTVEAACGYALGGNFRMLSLVGSVALGVETPGSDVDVVCFTKPKGSQPSVLPGDCLRRIRTSLQGLLSVGQGAMIFPIFELQLIEDARVPILRVLWGPPGFQVAVDILVDQRRPIDHVHWFQQIGAAPPASLVAPPVLYLVTATLRCVKWWLRQRQFPPTKEGGLPTLAWLLLAIHSCAEVGIGPWFDENKEPIILTSMTQLFDSLAAFFHAFSPVGALDGVLTFKDGSSDSRLMRRPKNKQSPWAELSVLDPTSTAAESSELAPRLMPATQLLIACELQRASSILRATEEECQGQMRRIFEPLPEGSNSLPASPSGDLGFGAIMWMGDPSKGAGIVELAIIDRVSKHPDWKAPFLHRSDTRSEVYVRLLDLDEATGRCFPRRKGGKMVLCPCHFVCRVKLNRSGQRQTKMALIPEDHKRLQIMQRYLKESQACHQAKLAAEEAESSHQAQ